MSVGTPRQQGEPTQSSVRHFLLLQGPCGAFFRELGKKLKRQGHRATRIVLNGGDLMDAGLKGSLIFRRSFADWPQWVAETALSLGVTDLVVYGDCRPYHRAAIRQLKPMGIRVHVLEEGYLRPHWITCEPDGVNGNSVLATIDLDDFDGSQLASLAPQGEVTIDSTHGRYMWLGARYYWWTMLLAAAFPRYVSHRDLEIVGEAALWLGRLFSWPWRRRRTEKALETIEALGKPVHLVLLQLNGDSQIREHSRFSSIREFVEFCVSEFAGSRTGESLLVFKNHPLDSGVVNLARVVREEARKHNLDDRIFFVETGKLVPLLEKSISVTAINSTACHQALRRGIPTMVLGKAVFNHPQIVPRMRLSDFFRLRPAVGLTHYEKLVNLLRLASQINGGYYSRRGRDTLLPGLVQRLDGPNVSPQSLARQGSGDRGALRAS